MSSFARTPLSLLELLELKKGLLALGPEPLFEKIKREAMTTFKSVCLQCGRPGSIPGSGRSPGEGNGNPLQYSCLGQEDPLEKEMATHSSTLASKIPWTEDRGRLQSTGSQRVGHD